MIQIEDQPLAYHLCRIPLTTALGEVLPLLE